MARQLSQRCTERPAPAIARQVIGAYLVRSGQAGAHLLGLPLRLGQHASHSALGHLSRTIPPATRRAVFIRDKGRCTVPGCRNHKHIELHHIKHYSRNGSHDPLNFVSIRSTQALVIVAAIRPQR